FERGKGAKTWKGRRFEASFDVASGANKIRVEAKDLAGNVAVAERVVSIDTQPPLVHLLSPNRGAKVAGASIDIVAVCLDQDVASLTINGIPASRGEQGRY